MAKISSSKIFAFPAIRRSGDYESNARNLSEKNIVGLINKLLDNGGTFVISSNIGGENADEGKPFEFMIGGYYFSISDPSLTPQALLSSIATAASATTKLYAKITLAYTEVDEEPSNYYELQGVDDSESGNYTGVDFVGSAPSDSNPYLYIATRSDTSSPWTVPYQSLRKYEGSRIGVIDGNEP